MPDKARAEPIDWGQIADQLQAGAYEAAAAYLWEVQLASQQANDGITAAVVAAIRQLCLACHECQRAIAAHQQAIQENSQREAELRYHAQTMLAHMTGAPTAVLMVKPTKIATPVTLTAAPAVALWTRIQRWASQLWRPVYLPSATEAMQALTAAPPVSNMTVVGSGMLSIDEAPLAAAAATSVEMSAAAETPPLDTAPETAPVLAEETSAPQPNTPESGTPQATQAMTPTAAPALVVYCLGDFRVYQNEQLIDVWPSGKGQLIFKYLLLNQARPVAKEVLMDLFWPDAPPEAARNNLNVAIYGLRRALRRDQLEFSHVLFQNDCYLLNPDMALWLDVAEFTQQLGVAQQLKQAGQQEPLIESYRAAEALYQGELLPEDRYEDWLIPHRQRLQDEYLKLLDYLSDYYLEQHAYELCAIMCNKILAVDPCQEDTHRRLMDCFNRQGQPHLALRQYHRCVELLARELDVGPSPPTQELYERIRQP